MQKIEKNSWVTFGRRLDATPQGTFDEGGIVIKEQISKLVFRVPEQSKPDPSQQQSGATISNDSYGIPIDAPLAVKLIQNGLSSSKLFFQSLFSEKQLSEDDKKAQKFLEGFINLSYGVTFDRGIMLKLLSQPNCEGLRAYLCSREDQGDFHTSLVMVGVDVNGYDLNYGPGETKVADIGTNSLLVEYGYPPGGRTTVNVDETVIDDHYALLKYAVENL